MCFVLHASEWWFVGGDGKKGLTEDYPKGP